MKQTVRLTKNDLKNIVKRVIKENERDFNAQVYSDFDSDESRWIHNPQHSNVEKKPNPQHSNVEKKPKYYYNMPSGYRYDYLKSKENPRYIADKYAVQFGEIHQLMISNYGQEPNIRDVVKECLLLAKRGTYAPALLEEYIFTQTDDKPKKGREYYFTQQYIDRINQQ